MSFLRLFLVVEFVRCLDVTVDVRAPSTRLEHFWRSTGFSPPYSKDGVHEFMLSEDESVNLALIGALPSGGIRQVRMHWLLNLISYENGSYNFTYLDELLDRVRENNLRPGFEIMGMPVNLKAEDVTNVYDFWYDLVHQVAKHYIGRYGAREVARWRFETWNEPDLRTYNVNNFTLNDYLSYVSATADALQSAQPGLKLGGPAGLFKRRESHPRCWGLLETCRTRDDCRLQFVSFHKKGNESAGRVLSEDLELLDLLHAEYPGTRGLPVANDEADILTNWSLDRGWRGDARYAAMAAKVIMDHYAEIVLKRKVRIEVLGNDNGFLNYHPHYFTQRTLFARFQMNNTTPRHVQFVQKPIYALMGLLSRLGNRHIAVKTTSTDPLTSLIATRNKRRSYAVMAAYVDDTASDLNNTLQLNVTFQGLRCLNCTCTVYLLDNVHTNPYKVWTDSGLPFFPTAEQRQSMRAVQGPFRLTPPTPVVNSDVHRLQVELTLPSIVLVHVCDGSVPPPGRVTSLQVLPVTSGEVLIIWKDRRVNSECIATYEVEFRPDGGQYGRVNRQDVVFLSYQHVDLEGVAGEYRVRAVDYWGRRGAYSKPCLFSH